MEVEAVEPRVREGFGEHHDRCSVAAAHVGDAGAGLELGVDTVEGGDPARQLGPVAGSEEPFGAREQARMMVAPAQCAVAAERGRDLVDIHEHRPEGVHGAGDEHRRVVIGERHGCFRRQPVPIVGGVVADESAGDLAIEPLAHQAGVAAGPVGDVVRCESVRTGQNLIQAEFVTQPDAEAQRAAGHVTDHLAHELAELGLVDCLCHPYSLQ